MTKRVTVFFLHILVILHSCYVLYVTGECNNFDFEQGTKSGWTRTGSAFESQPTFGDNSAERPGGEHANFQGDWWIGTYENRSKPELPGGNAQGDEPKGTLTSPKFCIAGPRIGFLVGGTCIPSEARVELLVSGHVVRTASAKNCRDTMEEQFFHVKDLIGKTAQVRLVDASRHGHLNFDDLKGDFHCGGMLPTSVKTKMFGKHRMLGFGEIHSGTGLINGTAGDEVSENKTLEEEPTDATTLADSVSSSAASNVSLPLSRATTVSQYEDVKPLIGQTDSDQFIYDETKFFSAVSKLKKSSNRSLPWVPKGNSDHPKSTGLSPPSASTISSSENITTAESLEFDSAGGDPTEKSASMSPGSSTTEHLTTFPTAREDIKSGTSISTTSTQAKPKLLPVPAAGQIKSQRLPESSHGIIKMPINITSSSVDGNSSDIKSIKDSSSRSPSFHNTSTRLGAMKLGSSESLEKIGPAKKPSFIHPKGHSNLQARNKPHLMHKLKIPLRKDNAAILHKPGSVHRPRQGDISTNGSGTDFRNLTCENFLVEINTGLKWDYDFLFPATDLYQSTKSKLDFEVLQTYDDDKDFMGEHFEKFSSSKTPDGSGVKAYMVLKFRTEGQFLEKLLAVFGKEIVAAGCYNPAPPFPCAQFCPQHCAPTCDTLCCTAGVTIPLPYVHGQGVLPAPQTSYQVPALAPANGYPGTPYFLQPQSFGPMPWQPQQQIQSRLPTQCAPRCRDECTPLCLPKCCARLKGNKKSTIRKLKKEPLREE